MLCQIVVAPQNIHAHLQQAHGWGRKPFDKEAFYQTVNDKDLSYDYPDQPTDLCIEFEGLKCINGYRCDIHGCNVYRGDEKSAKAHHHQKHKGIPRPEEWSRSYIQRWNHFNHPYFPVIPRSQVTRPHEDILHAVKTMVKDIMAQDIYAETDRRLVNPFLNKVGWHLHFEGQSFLSLHKLGAAPLHTEFLFLKAGLLHLLRLMTIELGSISELVRKKVNTEDRATGSVLSLTFYKSHTYTF